MLCAEFENAGFVLDQTGDAGDSREYYLQERDGVTIHIEWEFDEPGMWSVSFYEQDFAEGFLSSDPTDVLTKIEYFFADIR